MGLLDQIIGTLGGQEPVERLPREEADVDDPQSPDVAHWNELVGAAPPEAVQDAMAHAAQRINPQEYYEHITPGMRGTDPLGALGTLASRLLGSLTGGGSGEMSQMLGQVPGLLQQLLGNKALMLAAAGLAGTFLADRTRGR